MDRLYIFILALFASVNANACINQISTQNGQILYQAIGPSGQPEYSALNFGEVDENIAKDELIIISHNCDSLDDSGLPSVTVSISGNKAEFCLIEPPNDFFLKCPDPNPQTVYESVSLFFKPSTPGNKKKKLNFEAIKDGNDVSITTLLIGSTPARGPQDP